jgi:endoglucanase
VKSRWVRLALAALIAGGGVAVVGRAPLARKWKELRARPVLEARARLPREPVPFSVLATSQVGYGPAQRKELTAPLAFRSFRVLREDGSVAFEGGAPARTVDTDRLGVIRTAYLGDFTALEAPGRYHAVLDGGLASFPFDVGPGAYDATLRAVQRAFYYQRAFTAIEPRFALGPWVHDSDAHLAPPGEEKGWHDAGDDSLYGMSATNALFYLLEAYLDFAPAEDDLRIPESGNGVPDLLDEARWELSWMLSVQEPSGGFRNNTCEEHYGPYGTNSPEHMAPYRAGEVGTLATGRAAATLARAAYVFRTVDPAFADRCLQAAQRGYAYLAARPDENSDGPTCPAMRQDGDADVGRQMRMYAAAGLLLATGDPRYERDFAASYRDPVHDPGFQNNEMFAVYTFLRVAGTDPALRARILGVARHHADLALADGKADPFGRAGRTFWGSVAAGFHRALFSVKECLADPSGARADCEQALASVHYALGRNFLQLSFVSGVPGVTRARQHAFHHWLATLRATPYLFPGLVAGGPLDLPLPSDVSYPASRPVPVWGYFGDPAFPRDESTPLEGRYTDNDSFTANEIDVDWQGVAVYVLAFARADARGTLTIPR